MAGKTKKQMAELGAGKSDEKPSIDDKIARFDEMVEWFYGDDFNLDQALERYQTANNLAHEIEDDLEQLKNQISVVADFAKE